MPKLDLTLVLGVCFGRSRACSLSLSGRSISTMTNVAIRDAMEDKLGWNGSSKAAESPIK